MSTVTIKYSLPEEEMDMMAALKGGDMALVLWQLSHNTKKEIENKIAEEKLTAYQALDLFYEKLNDELEAHGIIINDLTQ